MPRSADRSYGSGVDRDVARQFLPEPPVLALRLDEAGADQRLIAVALEIEPEGVPGLLRIAREKLAALERVEPPDHAHLGRT
jgi:hypothetical protein